MDDGNVHELKGWGSKWGYISTFRIKNIGN